MFSHSSLFSSNWSLLGNQEVIRCHLSWLLFFKEYCAALITGEILHTSNLMHDESSPSNLSINRLARFSSRACSSKFWICKENSFRYLLIFDLFVSRFRTHSLVLALRNKSRWIPRWSVTLIFQTSTRILFRLQIEQRAYLHLIDHILNYSIL